MAEVIRAENLSLAYNSNEIISGLSFSVNSGDVLAVIGPNGSGKTTLLRALLGIHPVKAGRVNIFGKERLSPGEAERRISYIPQRMEFDRTFPISLGEMLGLNHRQAESEKYIEVLELDGLMKKKVGELSGGQMQRALLAYAILKGPELVVMDEPTSWIDARGSDCMLCIMEEFKQKGMTMIIVSHEYPSLKSIVSHVLGLGVGPGSAFFLPADTPGIEEKISTLLGGHESHGHHERHCRILFKGR